MQPMQAAPTPADGKLPSGMQTATPLVPLKPASQTASQIGVSIISPLAQNLAKPTPQPALSMLQQASYVLSGVASALMSKAASILKSNSSLPKPPEDDSFCLVSYDKGGEEKVLTFEDIDDKGADLKTKGVIDATEAQVMATAQFKKGFMDIPKGAPCHATTLEDYRAKIHGFPLYKYDHVNPGIVVEALRNVEQAKEAFVQFGKIESRKANFAPVGRSLEEIAAYFHISKKATNSLGLICNGAVFRETSERLLLAPKLPLISLVFGELELWGGYGLNNNFIFTRSCFISVKLADNPRLAVYKLCQRIEISLTDLETGICTSDTKVTDFLERVALK